MKLLLTRVVREPLLQFLALGACLFALNSYVSSKTDNPRQIVIDEATRQELASIFEEGQGRQPRPEEMQDLILTWTQNEVLYREARFMGLDNGDDMIRQRLILKIRNVLFNNLVAELPPDAELQRWFEARRAKYDTPESFDVEQFLVADSDHAEVAEQALATLGAQLPESFAAKLRRYNARPAPNFEHLFGQEGAARLLAAPQGTWVVVQSEQGFHLARVTARHPARPAPFAEVKNRVAREWKDQAKKADLSGALKDIVQQYDIRVIAGNQSKPREKVTQLEQGSRAALPTPGAAQ